MSYEVHEIISRQDLKDAVNFIHSNNFSLKTFEEKISYNLDDRVLGLLIKDKDKIVGNIFYYCQPNFFYKNRTYKVVNFATIFVLQSHRGKGIPRLMIEKTLEIFKDYIITDYTPVGSIMHLLKKFNFGFMLNNRNLILPVPLFKLDFFQNFFGTLSKITEKKTIEEILHNLEKYRHYEIELWNYKRGSKNLILGIIDRFHTRNYGFLKISLKSKRILWTNNEDLLIENANNIALNFSVMDKTYFITTDTESYKRPFFSIKLENQFMIYPKLNTKISTYGSEFFAKNL